MELPSVTIKQLLQKDNFCFDLIKLSAKDSILFSGDFIIWNANLSAVLGPMPGSWLRWFIKSDITEEIETFLLFKLHS